MSIKPEQIPDEAAQAALEKYYTMTGVNAQACIPHMKAALAAALPVLLGAKTWRRTKPTEPGAYYVRGFNWGRGELQFEALVQVTWHRFEHEPAEELVCDLHESTSEEDLNDWSPLCDLSDEFEWCGPLYTLPTQDTPNEH